MKKKFTLLFFLLMIKLIMPCKAQVPSWQWAKSAGGPDMEFGVAIDSDSSGNIYVTGNFFSLSISFDNITLFSTDSANLIWDSFIVKYSSAGAAQWAIPVHGSKGTQDYTNSLVTDANGNSYIVGVSNGISTTFGNLTLSSGIGFDYFLVKVDSSGNALWARGGVGTSHDEAKCVSIDNSGNVYAAGSFESTTLTCGAYSVNNISYHPDMFVAKYNSSGSVLWVRSGGGFNEDYASGICNDSYNNVWVGGYFESPTVNFGGTTLINKIATGNSRDISLTKYNSSGTLLWSRAFGGTDNDWLGSLASDANGNVFATGRFSSDTLKFDSFTLINKGNDDAFVVMFNSSGNVVWAKQAGGGAQDIGASIAAESNGNTFLSGYFYSHKIIFDNDTFINNNNSLPDIFNVKYDNLGNIIWAKHTSGTLDEVAIGNNIDIYGNLLVTGGFASPALQFGSTTLTAPPGFNPDDIFVAKLGGYTAIPEYDDEKSIRIYPNPSDGKIHVLCSEKIDELSVANIYGQEICSLTRPESNFYYTINANGIYFVTAIIKGDKVTRKIVVCK